jgi:anti-sigma factor RsiW
VSERPMRCGDVAPYLSAFSDGELEEPLRARIAEHVTSCAQCAAKVHRYATIDAAFGALPRSTPAPEVLDHVLASIRPAPPSPVTRESLLRRPKLLAPRRLPSLLRAPGAASPPAARPLTRRRPASAMSRVIPTLAAALLIVFSIAAFSRGPLLNGSRGGRTVATPQPVTSVLAETQRQVSAQQAALGFTPVVPTYLPPGAALQHVTVGAEPTDAAAHFLDMSWALGFPLAALHIRESGLPLDKRGDFAPGGYADATLTWSLGRYQWLPGLIRGAPAHCAVGEGRSDISIAVDVTAQEPGSTCDTTNFAAVNVLRLASLSLDAPYLPLTVRTPASTGNVLHYRAYKTVPSGYSWDVYINPARQRTRITALDPHGTPLYTDLIAGDGSLTRLDPRAKVYQVFDSRAHAASGEPVQLSAGVVTFFATANTLLGSGELWNTGLTAVSSALIGVTRAYKLLLVGAPYPTTVYVDPTTKAIVGATVEYQSSLHPGGGDASSKLTPSGVCPSYSEVQYQVASTIPPGTFDFTAPTDYAPGTVRVAPVTC